MMPNNSVDWPDLFKSWFVPLISIVGFGQYWIGLGLSRILHRVRSEDIEAIVIERDPSGDSLEFSTSLLASRRSVVVNQMYVTIHRVVDNARTEAGLDGISFQTQKGKTDALEYPRSFRLSMMDPVFIKPRFKVKGNGLDAHSPELARLWNEFLARDDVTELKISEQRESGKIDSGFVTKLILEFSNYCISNSIYGRLISNVFWHRSDYRVLLELRVVGRRSTVKKHFQFSVDENQANQLQKNAHVMITNTVRSQFGLEMEAFSKISSTCVAIEKSNI